MAETLDEMELLGVTELLSGLPSVTVEPIPVPGRGLPLRGTALVAEAEEILGLDKLEIPTEQKLFIIAYATYGTIAGACRAVGVSPVTHKKWMKDETYQELFETAFDVVTDRLEETSLRASLDPLNTKERMFHLQARRADRYASRVGVAIKGKVDHVHSISELARQAYNDGTLDKADDE